MLHASNCESLCGRVCDATEDLNHVLADVKTLITLVVVYHTAFVIMVVRSDRAA